MISTNEKSDLTLRVGDLDSQGEKVVFVFDREPDKYIIYKVYNGALKCGDSGISLLRDTRVITALMKIAEFYGISPALANKYDSHRAFGIRCWCRGEIEEAVQALEQTHEMLRRTFARHARLLYLSGSLLIIGVASLISLLSAALNAQTARTWCLVSLFGSLGAFASIAIKGQPPTMDILEDRWATVAYGAIRALVGVVFAVLIYLLVLGGVLLPGFAKEADSLLIISFVAGFSEKLVPEAFIHHAITGANH